MDPEIEEIPLDVQDEMTLPVDDWIERMLKG